MKRSRRQKLAMIVALILAAIMILPMVISMLIPGAGAAVTQKDIDKRESNKKVYQDQKKEAQKKLNDLKSERANAIEIKAALDKNIELLEMEIENSNLLIQDYNVRLVDLQQELEANTTAEQEAERLFRARLRTMEEAGDVSYLSILFQSSSFSDLLGRIDMVNEIMDADQRVIESLADARAAIEATKAQVELDKDNQHKTNKQLGEQQAELAEQYMAAIDMIAELKEETAEAEKAYQEADKAVKEVDDEVKRLQAELKKQQEAAKKSTEYVGGEYLFPVPGYTINTKDEQSLFGMRYHPILKRNKQHTGVDIQAPKGTKIVAANSGTVIIAGKSSSYGNYVVIDHGGGRATLYAHMSKITVSAGKTVERGAKIGEVGSTGMSTGNHLHFECIVNGDKVDPLNYLKKK